MGFVCSLCYLSSREFYESQLARSTQPPLLSRQLEQLISLRFSIQLLSWDIQAN